MKKIIVCVIVVFLFGFLSPKQAIPDEEIPDHVWDELSADLSKIYTLVETINKNIEMHRAGLKVNVENWEYPIGKKFSISTASEIKEYPIVKIGEVRIPTAKGVVDSKLFKTLSETGFVWFAEESKPKHFDFFTAGANLETIKFENQNIPLYAYGPLKDKTKAIPAMKQLVFLDGLIDKAFREVNEALKYVQKKYKDSPIYIEGFQVHIGINFSIDIMFKIKRNS